MAKQKSCEVKMKKDVNNNLVFSHVDVSLRDNTVQSYTPITVGKNSYMDTDIEKLQRRAQKIRYCILAHGNKAKKYMLFDLETKKVISTHPDEPPFRQTLEQIKSFIRTRENKLR